MTPEEEKELQKFRNEYPFRLEKARKIALRFGILANTALIAFVYAYFQQTAADKHRLEYELQKQHFDKALQLASEKAAKFEALAATEKARAHEIFERCQQIKRASR